MKTEEDKILEVLLKLDGVELLTCDQFHFKGCDHGKPSSRFFSVGRDSFGKLSICEPCKLHLRSYEAMAEGSAELTLNNYEKFKFLKI